jgi:hypothetical protein
MALRQDDLVHREPERTEHTERLERIEHFHDAAATAASTNVNVAPATPATDVVTVFTRVVMLVFSVLEILLLLRFMFKLSGANAGQPLIAELYAFTDALVRPFQGIFPEPRVGTVVDIAAVLAILFLLLVGALIVALVRAIAGRPAV